ncbi:MAG: O-antigen ligase family protein [Ruminococcus sp.]|nr:O-antigen ligase family protein [Ruminococcus sp.]
MNDIKKAFQRFVDAVTTEKAFFLLVVVTMLAIPVAELITQFHDRAVFTQPLIVEAAGILGTFMTVANIIRNRNKRLYPTDLFFTLLVVLAGLSLAFSQDLLESTRGIDFDEWLTDFLGYFSLMYAASAVKDNKLRKAMLGIFLVIMAIQGTLGVLQTFDIRIRDSYLDSISINKNHYPYGLTQHMNWFVALAGLYTCFTAAVTLFARTTKSFVLFLVVTCIGFYNLFTSGARLALMIVFALFAFYFVSIPLYCRRNKEPGQLKRMLTRLLILLAAAAAVFAAVYLTFGHYKGELSSTVSEMSVTEDSSAAAESQPSQSEEPEADTGSNNGSNTGSDTDNGLLPPTAAAAPHTGFDHFANERGFIWKYGLACVPKYWAFGIGLDNYRWCFSHPQMGLQPDNSNYSGGKAHNEYIHILVTQGVFQLLNYLCLYIYIFVVGIRTVLHSEDKEGRLITWAALGMFTAYALQAVFNSSLVNVAPYMWVTMGIILCVKDQRPFGYRKERRQAEQDKTKGEA